MYDEKVGQNATVLTTVCTAAHDGCRDIGKRWLRWQSMSVQTYGRTAGNIYNGSRNMLTLDGWPCRIKAWLTAVSTCANTRGSEGLRTLWLPRRPAARPMRPSRPASVLTHHSRRSESSNSTNGAWLIGQNSLWLRGSDTTRSALPMMAWPSCAPRLAPAWRGTWATRVIRPRSGRAGVPRGPCAMDASSVYRVKSAASPRARCTIQTTGARSMSGGYAEPTT